MKHINLLQVPSKSSYTSRLLIADRNLCLADANCLSLLHASLYFISIISQLSHYINI